MKSERFTLAAIVAIVLVTILTIGGELIAPLKAWLAATFFHHWIGKGVLAIVAFVLVGFFGPSVSLEKIQKAALPLIVACTVALFAFFTAHFLHLF